MTTAYLDVERELLELGLAVERRDQGGELRLACPLCARDPDGRKRDPAFAINATSGVWHCHRCNERGNAWTLRKRLRGEPSVAHAARRAQAPKPATKPLDEALVAALEAALWAPAGAEALAYLRSRAFTDESIRAFRMGFCARRGGVAIPYLAGGEPVGIKYRLLPGRDVQRRYEREPGHHHPLFNGDALDGENRAVLLVEGELDAIAGTQAGLGVPVVSLPDGATGSLDEVAEAVERFDEVLLGLDADPKGDEGAAKLAEKLGAFRCRRVRWRAKDLNEALVSGATREDLLADLEAASACGKAAVRHVREWREELLAAPAVEARGRPTGWAGLDELLGGLRPGEVSLLTASTGQGKSTWALDLARRQAAHGHAVLIASLELQTIATVRRLLCGVAGMRWDKLEPDSRRFAVDQLVKLPVYVLDHYGSMPVERLRLEVEYAVRRFGVGLAILDHLHFMLGVRRPGEDERLLIDEAAMAVQRMALSLGIHVLLVMHPKKIDTDRDGKTRAPEIADLKGSSGPAQYADNVVRLARFENETKATLTLLKVRSELAKLGSVLYRFDPDALRFIDLDTHAKGKP